MPDDATAGPPRPMAGGGAELPARKDLTVRDAILAAVERNSGVPVPQGEEAVGERPVDGPGSGGDSGRSPGEPPAERDAVRSAERSDERSDVPAAGGSDVRRPDPTGRSDLRRSDPTERADFRPTSPTGRRDPRPVNPANPSGRSEVRSHG
jgi:hypothetical protein